MAERVVEGRAEGGGERRVEGDGERLGWRALASWLALLVGFSPVLAGLATSLHEDPGHRYVLLPLLLVGLVAWRGGSAPGSLGARAHASPRALPNADPRVVPLALGGGLLAAGVVLELIGLATATSVVARAGLPLAIAGLAVRLGRPDPRIALLAALAIPIPDFVKSAGSPDVETALAGMMARVGSLLGAELEAAGPLLLHGERSLELVPSDGGLVAAVLCAAFATYRALLRSDPSPALGWAMLRGAVIGSLIQPLLLLGATLLFAAAGPALARLALYAALATGLALLALGTAVRGLQAPGAAPPGAAPIPGSSRGSGG